MYEEKKLPFFAKIIILAVILFAVIGVVSFFNIDSSVPKATQKSILALDLKGILVDKHKFLKNLRKYSESDRIKGF